MAAIVEFLRPVNGLGSLTGAEHGFLLLQNDAGQFTDIARGGPESAAAGPLGLNTEGSNVGFGLGNVVTNVEPYSPNSGTPSANDFFTPEQLGTFQSRVVMSGSEADMRAAFDQLAVVGQQINDAKVPYDPLTANSNSALGTFESALGVTPVENRGLGSDQFVPGADNNLLQPQTGLLDSAISKGLEQIDNVVTGITNGVQDFITNTINKTIDDFINSLPDPNIQIPWADIGNYIANSIIPSAEAGTLGTPSPVQYVAETQTVQEQLSGLPASPDAQVQSGEIVAPPWETSAQPVDFLRETLNFQQLSSGAAPAEQPMEQQGTIAGDSTASSAFLMSNESGLISFESPNGTPVVDSTGFQNNGINNTQGVDTITGSPTFDQIMQTFDQTVANTNVDNNPAPIDNYPTQAPIDNYPTQAPVDNYPAPVDNFGGSFGGTGYPLVLDLAGKGIKITPLSSSNQFFNMTDDGYQHRTAWAAA